MIGTVNVQCVLFQKHHFGGNSLFLITIVLLVFTNAHIIHLNRVGPSGKKTLCNACGIRWRKNNSPPMKSTPLDTPIKKERQATTNKKRQESPKKARTSTTNKRSNSKKEEDDEDFTVKNKPKKPIKTEINYKEEKEEEEEEDEDVDQQQMQGKEEDVKKLLSEILSRLDNLKKEHLKTAEQVRMIMDQCDIAIIDMPE